MLAVKNEADVAAFFGVSAAAYGMFKKRKSIGTIVEKLHELGSDVSIDALLSSSNPELYQLAKETVNISIVTHQTQELEQLLSQFYFKAKLKKTIEDALYSPVKEGAFFTKVLDSLSGDSKAVLLFFEAVLKKFTLDSITTTNAKKILISAIEQTSLLQLVELRFFFEKDKKHLLQFINTLDDRDCEAILKDIPAVLEVLEKEKSFFNRHLHPKKGYS